MCTGAILLYKIPRVVIGENETFMGNEDLLRSRGVEVVVADSQECKDLMARFIAEKPEVSSQLTIFTDTHTKCINRFGMKTLAYSYEPRGTSDDMAYYTKHT